MIPFAKNRFVTVREFKGKVLIDLREYYEKDGKTLPGNKGISLTPEQYTTFKSIMGEIDEKVAEM